MIPTLRKYVGKMEKNFLDENLGNYLILNIEKLKKYFFS